MEYAHNSLICSATGLSPFQCVFSYQPSLSPALNADISRPSALAYLRRCRQTWAQAWANHRRTPAPSYRVDQMAWLSTWDLPLCVESKKLDRTSTSGTPTSLPRIASENPLALDLRQGNSQ